MWIVFALLAALSAAVVVTLSKAGLKNVEPSLAFAVQSVLILIVAWSAVVVEGLLPNVARIERKAWIYLIIAGVVTCVSSLLSFRALKLGDASRVSSLERLSLVFAIVFAAVFLKEKLTWQVIVGGAVMVAGAVLIAVGRS
ncbi:MAG: EamA family transporter [Sphingobacteriaceae bacterium]|nr:EamA family transporter [Cytophagaceae bacterium]